MVALVRDIMNYKKWLEETIIKTGLNLILRYDNVSTIKKSLWENISFMSYKLYVLEHTF